MEIKQNRIFLGIVLFFIFTLTLNKNSFSQNDKLKHFGISTLFGAAGETYLHYKTNLKTSERIMLAASLGSLPGLIKELVDSTKKGNHFSGSDMAANIAGAFFGALAGNLINTIIQIKTGKTEKERTVTISLTYKF